MSKTVSASWATTLALRGRKKALCAKLSRRDGTEHFLTTHDENLVYAGDTYLANPGFAKFAIEQRASLNVNSTDISSPLFAGEIDDVVVKAGLLARADVEVFWLLWDDIPAGPMKLMKASVGEITLKDDSFVVELRGLLQALQVGIIRTVQPLCIVDLGSTGLVGCNVRLDPPAWTAATAVTVRPSFNASKGSVVKPTVANGFYFECSVAGTTDGSEPAWNAVLGATTTESGGVAWIAIRALTVTGTVTSLTDRKRFTDTARTEPDGFFDFGVVTWTTGSNAGIGESVKTHASDAFVLYRDLPFDIEVGDQYSMTKGCGKLIDTNCRDEFDNVRNFQGFPYLPGNDEILRFGGS